MRRRYKRWLKNWKKNASSGYKKRKKNGRKRRRTNARSLIAKQRSGKTYLSLSNQSPVKVSAS